MNVKEYHSPSEILKKCGPALREKEAENCLPLGILMKFAKTGIGSQNPSMALVEENGKTRLLLLITPPHNLIIRHFGGDLGAGLSAAARYLSEHDWKLPGAIGERRTIEAFSDLYCATANRTATISMEQKVYKCTEVNDLPDSPGKLHLATNADLELLSRWLYVFTQEAVPEEANIETQRERSREYINSSTAFIWQDGTPVSMALAARPMDHGISMAGVFTPKMHRNRGYATTCVLNTTKRLLNSGYDFCTLYTDLSNPTSNSIYQKIGYIPIEESIMVSFGEIKPQ